jgi:hypothetical protein
MSNRLPSMSFTEAAQLLHTTVSQNFARAQLTVPKDVACPLLALSCGNGGELSLHRHGHLELQG